MDIQVGDRITYKKKDVSEIRVNIISSKFDLSCINSNLIHDKIELLKIERPKYEEIKELLTKEEKEFLKSYIRLIGFENNVKFIEKMDNHIIALYLSDNSDFRFEISTNENFIGIENYIRYSTQELGL